MKPYIFDATPLIYLAKTGLIVKLGKLEGRKIMPKSVFDEVVIKGMQQSVTDAKILKEAVNAKIFEIKEAADKAFLKKLAKNSFIDIADAEVLAIAKELNGMAIMDDSDAKKLAKIEGINAKGTAFLLFRLLKKGLITKNGFREKFNQMIENGWYCSVDFYATVMDELDKI